MSGATESPHATIEPFWNRLPAILRYPLHMGALLTVVVLGLAHLLSYVPLGWLWVLLATVAMYRYAFDCLLASANGELEPPEIGLSDDDGMGWRFIGLIITLMVFVIVCGIFLGRGVFVVALLLAFALPGIIITLALEQSVLRSLNPGKWLAVITRIGWPYLAAFGLCVVVLLSETQAKGWVAQLMPAAMASVLIAIIGNYAMLVGFHLMGYLVYQYHDALGFDAAGPQATGPLARPDPDQDVLDEAAQLVRDGHPEAATACLRSHLRGRGGTPKVHQQYRKLLHLSGDQAGLLKHGQEHVSTLMAQDKDREALALVRDCQTLDPKFGPPHAEQVTRLARLAADSGQAKLALSLLSGFHQRFPKSPDIVRNYVLAATLMHEHLGQDAKAHSLLSSLKSNNPDKALMPQINETFAMIEKMMAAAHPAKTKTTDASPQAPQPGT
ncbi:MAG: hypothetical protein L0H70_05155 [Xanthomonadales bacterium]|nr:hypothetical protein [Xanthomonadales bacterium]